MPWKQHWSRERLERFLRLWIAKPILRVAFLEVHTYAREFYSYVRDSSLKRISELLQEEIKGNSLSVCYRVISDFVSVEVIFEVRFDVRVDRMSVRSVESLWNSLRYEWNTVYNKGIVSAIMLRDYVCIEYPCIFFYLVYNFFYDICIDWMFLWFFMFSVESFDVSYCLNVSCGSLLYLTWNLYKIDYNIRIPYIEKPLKIKEESKYYIWLF